MPVDWKLPLRNHSQLPELPLMEFICIPEGVEVASTGRAAAAKAQKPLMVELALLGVEHTGTESVWL